MAVSSKNREKLAEEVEQLRSRLEELQRSQAVHKEAQKALQDSEARFRTAIESLPFDFFLIDKSGRYAMLNEVCRQHWGDIVGKRPEDICPDEQTLALWQSNNGRAFAGEVVEAEVVLKPKDKEGCYRNIISPIRDGDEIRGILGVNIDITQYKEAECALQETTRLLETIFDTTHILIAYLDPQFNFIKVNKAYALADEKEPPFFPGKNHFDLYPDEENEAVFRRVVETGEPYFAQAKPFEYAEHPERGMTYWDWSLIPIRETHGGVTGLVLSLANVTQRKLVEKALRESEGKLNAMLQSVADHMSMMDEDLNIIWANDTARDKFGDDIVGRKCYEAYHGRSEPCEPYPCLTLKAFRDGKVHEHDTQVVDKDGNTRYFHCSANVALRDEQEKPTAVLEISRDITGSKRAEEQIENLARFPSENPNPVLRVAKDGKVLYSNDPGVRLLAEWKSGVGEVVPERWRRSVAEACRYGKDGNQEEEVGDKIFSFVISPVVDSGYANLYGRNITERKKAEEALRESENSYRAVVENAAEGIVVVQGQRLQFVNPRLVSMTGYSEKELLTRPFIEFVHPDHREWAMGIHIKRLRGEDVPPTYEIKVLDKEGNTKWLENNGILIKWGNRPATLNFLRDVTERKQTEQAIWASESEKRSILNAISDHILFHDTDLAIRWGNEAAARSIGMTQQELVGCYCYELWQGRSEPCERCPVLRAIETGSHTQGIMTTPDGKCWEITGEPVLDRDGEIRGAIEISRDISERKKAEESLKYRMEFERLITVLSKSFIDPGDIDEKIKEALKSIGEFAGVDRAYIFQLRDDGGTADNTHEWCADGIEPQVENLQGITLDDELPWFCEKIKAHETLYVPVVAELPPEAHLEKEHFEIQGIQALVVAPMLSKGKLSGFLGFDSVRSQKTWPQDIIAMLSIAGENISLALDRERAEQRARLLSSTVEQSSEGMAVVDLQGNLLFLNNAFAAMHRYEPEELIGRHMSIFHTPEQMPSVEAANRRTEETGEFNGEIWHVRRDGTFFPGLMHNSLLRDDSGSPAGMIGTLRDITESKEAGQALKESEIKFRSITEESLVGVYVIQDGVFKYVNPKFAEIFGYSADELINKKGPADLIYPEDWPAAKENLRKRIAGEIRSIQYAFRGLTKDKEIIHVEVYGSATEYQGRPAVIGTLLDVTERKKAEEELRVKNNAIASSITAIAIAGFAGNLTYVNNSFLKMWGYDDENEVLGEPTLEFWHHKEKAQEIIESLRRGHGSIGELVAKRKDGSLFDVQFSAGVVSDETGTPICMMGSFMDITERKQAQVTLQESELKFKTIFENAGGAIFIADNETGIILECNSQAERMLGSPRAEIIGMHQSKIHPEGETQKYAERFAAHVQKGHIVDFEGEVRHADGGRIPVWISAQCLKIGGKDVVLGLFIDTSELRKAEKKLLEYQVQLKSLASQLSLTEERERRQIATELHDRIGQSLVISKIKLDELRESAASGERAEALKEVCNCLAQVIQDTRVLTFDLSFPILYELGFEAAVAEWLAEQIREKHGIEAKFEDDGKSKPLDDDIRVILFRNVRELLINVVKHANAQNVKVSIRKVREKMCVTVEDDGVGFDPVEAASMAVERATFGLFSIRERLEQLEGYLEIRSEPGRGSKITMTAPLKH